MKNLSRRRLLKVGASTLLASAAWPGALWADDSVGENFGFLVVNDLHFFDKNCVPYFEKVIASMAATKEPMDFCIIAGDLSESGSAEQISAVRELFKGLKMPLYTVPGNHDYTPKNDRSAYEQLMPKMMNYTLEHKRWQFVALDSTDGTKAKVAILKPTLDYVAETTPKLDKKRPTILFTHFPLGDKVTNRATNADAVLEQFKPTNLRAIFGGHYHAFTERKFGDATVTTNRCCSFHVKNHDGTKEKGYFVCQAKEGKVERKFVEVAVG
ncbi:MAG TPA: metallophosphoesterase [Tepidisphaeraceae bacterium]|nr:metallophosphoesterase [Tepidisphaeraceae bacterium]